MASALVDVPAPVGSALAWVERARREHNMAAARKYDAVREFALDHVRSEIALGRADPEGLEDSVVAQLGLALQVSPHRARRVLRVARDLHAGLDGVRALFMAG